MRMRKRATTYNAPLGADESGGRMKPNAEQRLLMAVLGLGEALLTVAQQQALTQMMAKCHLTLDLTLSHTRCSTLFFSGSTEPAVRLVRRHLSWTLERDEAPTE